MAKHEHPTELLHPDKPEVSPATHLIAPLAAIGATLLVRKIINSGYERVTKTPPPAPSDPSVGLGRALAWAVTIAATAAIAEVVAFRIVNRIGRRDA